MGPETVRIDAVTTTAGTAEGAEAAVLMVSLVAFAIMLVTIIAQWKIYKKAGQPGWAVLVPIYNMYVITKFTGRQGWWIALMFVPFVNLFALIVLWHDVSKSFGKGAGFTAGLILLAPIFYLILGFGKAEYLGPKASGFGLPNSPIANAGGIPGQPMVQPVVPQPSMEQSMSPIQPVGQPVMPEQPAEPVAPPPPPPIQAEPPAQLNPLQPMQPPMEQPPQQTTPPAIPPAPEQIAVPPQSFPPQ